MTGQQIVDWLWNNIDRSKLTINSIVSVNGGLYRASIFSASGWIFGMIYLSGANGSAITIQKAESTSKWTDTSGANYLTQNILSSGGVLKVYY